MTGEEVPVEISGFAYVPDPVQIDVGDSVVWTNRDQIYHSVTAGTPERPQPERFDGDTDGREDSPEGYSATFSRTFTDPGEIPYFCTRHPTIMTGTIVVG